MLLRTLLLRLYRLPVRSVHRTPADLGLEAHDVEFAAIDGARLRGWFLPAVGADDGGPRPVVVVMHGWASAAEDLLPAAPAGVGAGLSMLFVDARGHGRSDAVEFMSMPRFAEDLRAAVAWSRERSDVDAARVALVGHSVGAGAALLHGLDDRTVPADDAERLAAVAPSATLLLVPGADHRSLDGFLPVLPEVVAHLRDALVQTPSDRDP